MFNTVPLSVPFLDFQFQCLESDFQWAMPLCDVIIYFNWNCKFVSAQTESSRTWKCTVGAFAWEMRKLQKSAAIQNDSGPGGWQWNQFASSACVLVRIILRLGKMISDTFRPIFKLNTCMLIEIHRWGLYWVHLLNNFTSWLLKAFLPSQKWLRLTECK